MKLPPKPQSQIVAEAAAKKVEKKKDVDMVRHLMIFVMSLAELPFSDFLRDSIFNFICTGFRGESALSLRQAEATKQSLTIHSIHCQGIANCFALSFLRNCLGGCSNCHPSAPSQFAVKCDAVVCELSCYHALVRSTHAQQSGRRCDLICFNFVIGCPETC